MHQRVVKKKSSIINIKSSKDTGFEIRDELNKFVNI